MSFVVIFLTALLTKSAAVYPRIDCHPDKGATEERCIQRGCIWQAQTAETSSVKTGKPPSCYFANTELDKMAGYDVVGMRNQSIYVTGGLVRRNTPTLFGNDLNKLSFIVEYLTPTLARLRVQDPMKSRFQVPQLHIKRFIEEKRKQKRKLSTMTLTYDIEVMENPFGVVITRRSTGSAIFDSRKIPGFTFSDQYLQMSIKLPSGNIYGIGEQTHTQLKHNLTWQEWPIFTRDYPPKDDRMNLYGSHPFYLCVENTGDTHGVLLLNSHAMSVTFQPDPIVTFRAIGGVLDFLIFLGPEPNTVVEQYTELIGRPALPPYWALGFHLCRFGYKNLTYLKQVFDRNRLASIPQDVQWIDADYMADWRDFTYNTTTFAQLPAFVDKLHSSGMKLVLIVDPGISSKASVDYEPLELGLKMNVFVKDNRTGKPIEGEVWPGGTYWPDFTNPNASLYWLHLHQKFHKTIQFDGIWIDMNEPSNFKSGSTTGCSENNLNNPPYTPLAYTNITEFTICLDADQSEGKHYDLHNLYGYTEAIATNKALRIIFPKKRPFVLSRSTYVGSGFYTAHWSGDCESSWSQMAWSVITMLEFNFFGIPFEGSDVCGFAHDTTEELCLRWHQLGAFYPFMRNHNDALNKVDQDPAAWTEPTVAAIRFILQVRYALLPYLYTLMYHAHVHGSSVARPLFFEFPTDADLLGIGDQFLWGSALMIAPILVPNTTERKIVFPPGIWYTLLSGEEVSNSKTTHSRNHSIPLGTKAEEQPSQIALFLRGGYIIPFQIPAENTVLSRQNPLGILGAMDNQSQARGNFYWDDGESVDSYVDKQYTLINFTLISNATDALLSLDTVWYGYKIPLSFENVVIFGVPSEPQNVKVNGIMLATENVRYRNQLLYIANTSISLAEKFDRQTLSWTYK